MESLKAAVFVLFVLLNPVSCQEIFFTDPVICYFLDAFLMVYCIAATALFFREKFSKLPRVDLIPEEKGGIYQELERPKDTDPYQALEPMRAKKKDGKKKKAKTQTQQRDMDQYEAVRAAAPANSSRH